VVTSSGHSSEFQLERKVNKAEVISAGT